ncbi:type IX secretion system membrane protein PorP/SprF [Aquimarina sp. ERC-38]|uniref:PorP/SprF family type IX secretion system membrane protein n=1 Tax=Aquimarina sp. ERC-38 TaxID=2949996 RepID=UPI00224662BC|nr:type IX secretion system membrane protein PorP/SprF [Aquimarina sp. ERC-38]UZO81848.1 type IX secretion system membrane protein PorP/SprF [Aquimarina sp. ERC-38]
MKNYIRYICGVLLFCSLGISTPGFGQELFAPVQNQYLADNPYLISSAYAGIGDCWQVRGTGFEQWVQVKNGPSTQNLSIDGRISDRSGVGAILFNDSNGATSQRGAQVSFAHHLTLSEYNNQYLSFGLSYRYTQFGIDTSQFNNGDPDNPISPSLQSINYGNSNFDLGILYRLGRFFLSANAVNLIDKQIDDFGELEPTKLQNYYLYTGYTFYRRFGNLEIEPSILYQSFASDGRSAADINIKVRKLMRQNYIWAGLTLRSIIDQEFKPLSVSPMIGIKRAGFYVAYGYQVGVNESLENLSTAAGSHMITLGFDFACRQSKCGCTY